MMYFTSETMDETVKGMEELYVIGRKLPAINIENLQGQHLMTRKSPENWRRHSRYNTSNLKQPPN